MHGFDGPRDQGPLPGRRCVAAKVEAAFGNGSVKSSWRLASKRAAHAMCRASIAPGPANVMRRSLRPIEGAL